MTYHYLFLAAMIDKYERLSIEGKTEAHRQFAREQLQMFETKFKILKS